jgi:hypothetical protein
MLAQLIDEFFTSSQQSDYDYLRRLYNRIFQNHIFHRLACHTFDNNIIYLNS